ncbi:hypothetical protein CHH28_08165 [Bacterioplanes sanyensis]|uniref:Twin-arginine translocation pathway signal n=1 Tax=Bacterioplanes sanyensis TaxID=1249553 RepID=A0A222FK92_9GAMM|nr:DUF1513 domain-containing protein [Bacterioplanes sanyensis]ASP38653.1 hypothetical protein CHH28_08165 [Bacterioplanes sanyensis]
MRLSRRQFLQLSCAASAMSLAGAAGVYHARPSSVWMTSGYRDQATRQHYGVMVMNARGHIVADFAVPERVHMTELSPDASSVLVSSREPGAPLRRYHLHGELQASLLPPKNMHFEGHLVVSDNGEHLFATASDYVAGQGHILVIDARSLQLQAIWPTHGTGPHELVYEQQQLWVANTGVRTHPDTGRTALNIEQMQSELLLLDANNGAVKQRWQSPKQALSVRHLDVLADGRALVGCQYQRQDQRPPCVAIADANSAKLTLLETDNDWLHWDMQGYTASVRTFKASSPLAGQALISNPRGHLLSEWQTQPHQLQQRHAMQYSKGVYLYHDSAWISAGAGELWRWQDGTLTPITTAVKPGIWWENHLHGRIV